MARKLNDRDLGIVARVACDVPVRAKGDGAYVVRSVKVAVNDGHDATDAGAFATALRASLAQYRAAHPAVPASGRDETRPLDGQPRAHYAGTHDVRRLRDDRGLAELAAAFAARRGRPYSHVVTPAEATASLAAYRAERKAARKPRARRIVAASPLACERCGRTDFRTPAGRAWHVENNPGCASLRKAHHVYAAA